MGFFSKIWKGVKKTFKKIGRGIKKAVAKVGKFVGKLGIVGQIGMFFIMPHLAGFLMKGLGGAANFLTGIAGKGLGSSLARGLGHVLRGAHNFATAAGNAFSTVTKGVSEFAKTALNKIPGVTIDGAATNFFGNDGAWSRTMDKASTIFEPFKNKATSFGDKTLSEFSNSKGISEKQLIDLNPELGGLESGASVPEGVYRTFETPAIDVPGASGSAAGTSYDARLAGSQTGFKGDVPEVPTGDVAEAPTGKYYDKADYEGQDVEFITQDARLSGQPAIPLADTLKPPGTVNQSLISKAWSGTTGRYKDLGVMDAIRLAKQDYGTVASLISTDEDFEYDYEPPGMGSLAHLGTVSPHYSQRMDFFGAPASQNLIIQGAATLDPSDYQARMTQTAPATARTLLGNY